MVIQTPDREEKSVIFTEKVSSPPNSKGLPLSIKLNRLGTVVSTTVIDPVVELRFPEASMA
jgi:hypothetical protein